MATENAQVRSLLIANANEQLLLPNSMVAEVLTYQRPTAVDNTPDWFLGHFEWRERRVPAVSLDAYWTGHLEEIPTRARLVVCHALRQGSGAPPQLAILANSMPRLMQADRATVLPGAGQKDKAFALAEILLNGERCLIPDLAALAEKVSDVWSPELATSA